MYCNILHIYLFTYEKNMTAIIGRGREREHPRNINISRERRMSYLHYIGPTTIFFSNAHRLIEIQ